MSTSQPSIRESQGVSRNLTYEFKKLRKENSTKKSRFQLSAAELSTNGSEKLLENIDSNYISRHSLPPLWVDIYDQVIDDLKKLEDAVPTLGKIQRQRLAITFGSTKSKDIEIRNIGESISQLIRSIDKQIKDLENQSGNVEDRILRKNISQSFFQRLQQQSIKYKKIQQDFVKKIKSQENPNLISDYNEDFLADDKEEYDKDDLMEVNVAMERNEAIIDLVTSIQDLADVFKELSTLVMNQGTILDRIDYNIEKTLEETTKANKELVKAEKHQRCTRATGCIVMLVILIVLLILALGLKHFIMI
ncbi:unnamed protein product [Blepharisma stoltei]|uniref:t-SNARE coiled-coil homology domain-containing protein n=1 Tax=Blepharisma stoltei TaxID=1481888 RepID=A0AAU9JGT3_9CILI|nr:unnamed protein product [Blepharisma stoltei]